MLNILQTHDELAKIGILGGHHNLVCRMCLGLEENLIHLFLLCPIASKVWLLLSRWIDLGSFSPSVSVGDHLAQYLSLLQPKLGKFFCLLFWLAAVWSFWLVRNEILFKAWLKGVPEIIGLVKKISLEWFGSRIKIELRHNWKH